MILHHYRAAALAVHRLKIPSHVPLSEETCAGCHRAVVCYTPAINQARAICPDVEILCPACADADVENFDGPLLLCVPAIEEAHLPKGK